MILGEYINKNKSRKELERKFETYDMPKEDIGKRAEKMQMKRTKNYMSEGLKYSKDAIMTAGKKTYDYMKSDKVKKDVQNFRSFMSGENNPNMPQMQSHGKPSKTSAKDSIKRLIG